MSLADAVPVVESLGRFLVPSPFCCDLGCPNIDRLRQ